MFRSFVNFTNKYCRAILTDFGSPILWGILFIVFTPLILEAQVRQITVGFLARNDEPSSESEFQRTVDQLNEYFQKKSPAANRTFVLLPLTFDKIYQKVIGKQVDFLIVNPLNFVDVEDRFEGRAIATLRRSYQGSAAQASATKFGGVIFELASESPSSPSISDLRGKDVFAVSETSFGGLGMQLTELRESQMTNKDIKLHYVKTHNAVIKNVLEHKGSWGFVRSGELEAYCTTNHIDRSRFNIIHPKSLDGEDTRQFPYAVSTRLYPEWPFVALPYVEESVIQDVAVALLTMNQYANPNSPGETLSWATPSSYMKARMYLSAIETNSERVHISIEFWGFLILSGIMTVVLIAAAERGRRRRNVSFHVTNFFPCVLAALPTHTAIIIIILLIGATERSAEAFIRDRGFGSSYLNMGLGLATFIGMAISAHFVSGPTTERSITLEKLEEILQAIADKTSSWEKLEEYCRSHNITEDEFDSIEARFQAMRKPRQTPVDLSKHRDKWKQ